MQNLAPEIAVCIAALLPCAAWLGNKVEARAGDPPLSYLLPLLSPYNRSGNLYLLWRLADMADDKGGSHASRQLPADVQRHIVSTLSPNERALSGRLVSPDLRDALSEPQHCTASLCQLVPPHAVPWAVAAAQQHVRQLPFRHKLHLLCTAAASGSEDYLEVMLPLLQQSIFPGLWYVSNTMTARRIQYEDPGVAAVEAGYPQRLAVLLERCLGLLHPERVLAAAAKHCDLAGLQAAWELLRGYPSSIRSTGRAVVPGVPTALEAAAESTTPDAVAKMEWALATGDLRCSLSSLTAAAAVRSGDLGGQAAMAARPRLPLWRRGRAAVCSPARRPGHVCVAAGRGGMSLATCRQHPGVARPSHGSRQCTRRRRGEAAVA